ncbi:MAG TPA: CdaR family protein [Thermoanaerobaculia bacterium]
MTESGRDWGLRLLALGIALGIWFNASVEDRLVSTEKVVEASVSYISPRGFVVVNPVQNVNVRLAGSKKAIRQLNPSMVDVQVDLSRRPAGMNDVTLSSENVLAPDGLDVTSIEPNTIRLDLEREVTQRLPVFPKLTGEPAAGSVVQEPEVFPSQVLVTGPESILARVESLSTAPISLDGHALPFEESVAVAAPDPLIQIVQPARVTVRIPLKPADPAAPKQTPKEKRKP